MTTIKAPFNFVPVSDNVFFPDWAKQISHDIPFSDGESGVINLTITAESPIFVRNGQVKSADDNTFSNINEKYFIPATSIKGAIRNVLEIMSFGKMSKVDDDSFGVRDLNNQEYRDKMKDQHCGWLQYTNDGYMLQDCGIPYRIPISAVDKKYKTKLEEFAKNPNNFKKDAGRTAKAKYDAIGEAYFLKQDVFEKDVELDEKMKAKNPIDPRSYVKFGGNKKGTLILTGQPGVRRISPRTGKGEGKFYEFVFFETNTPTKKVDERIVNAFRTIHKSSPDFTAFWGQKLNRGEKIPVFFQYNKDKTLHSMGLSYLYKYPYDKSVSQSIPKNDEIKEKWNNPDLSDCIFGYTNKSDSLKGRVQFSAAFSENAQLDTDKRLILGSPKASYYPLYVRQNGRNGTAGDYQTYNKGVISGWKRYLLRKNVWEHNEGSDTLDTIIRPVKQGAVFTCKVRYHNLKKVELGALLSALTFHNTSGCYHQLGQAKPYGFGKVKIEFQLSDNHKELLKLFEDTVRKAVGEEWKKSEQIKELFTMASVSVGDEDVFKYMKMSKDRNSNEFLQAKAEKLYLRKFSELSDKSVLPDSNIISLEQQLEIDYAALIDVAKSLKDNMQYENAKLKIAEAEKIFPDKCEHDLLLNEINTILNQQKKEAEVKKQQEEQVAKDKKKIEGGLSFLEELNLKGEYKVQDLKGAKNRIEQWMKKANVRVLPEEQREMFRETLSRLYQQPNKGEQKLWKDFNSSIWETIKSYIGENEANKWFNEIIK